MSRPHHFAALAALVAAVALAVGGAGSAAGDEGVAPETRPGDLVTTFGDGGVLHIEPDAGKQNAGEALAADAAGRVLLLTSDSDGASRLVRLLEDGSPDPGFGAGGTLTLPAGTWEDVAVDPSGRIVLSGTSGGDLALARLTPAGAPDPSFGTAGVARLQVALPADAGLVESTEESLSRLVLLPDGGIVAGGALEGCYTESCFAKGEVVARFTAGGAPDPGFGSGGAFVADFGRESKSGQGFGKGFSAVAVQPDGKVLLGGTDGGRVTVLRLTAAGAPDRSFGHAGYFSTGYETSSEEGVSEIGTARALLLEEGRIVVVGDSFLYRLLPSGRPDLTFGDNGHAAVAPPALFADSLQTTDALIDAAGQIVVVGAGPGASTFDRYGPDGRADARFGGGGLASISLADTEAPEGKFGRFTPGQSLESVVALPDGDLVAAGYAYHDREQPQRQVTVLRRNDAAGHLAQCAGKPVVFQGTPGPDRIGGVTGPVATFGGNDTVRGGHGALCTGPGNDFVRGRSGGPISLGTGDDRALVGGGRVLAGPGDDIVRLGPGFTASINASGGPGADLLVGGGYRDHLAGGPGDDRLYGKGARDVLLGGPGNDLLAGGTATDLLRGGPGRDRILPGTGSPPTMTYATKSANFRLRILIRHHQVTAVHMRIVTDCSDGTQTITWLNESQLHLPIRRGRFVYGETSDFDGFAAERLTGEVHPSRIVGTYFQTVNEEDSEHNFYTCATGPVGNRGPIHYVARRR